MFTNKRDSSKPGILNILSLTLLKKYPEKEQVLLNQFRERKIVKGENPGFLGLQFEVIFRIGKCGHDRVSYKTFLVLNSN